jgi:hypothetical protein
MDALDKMRWEDTMSETGKISKPNGGKGMQIILS